jgi:hypothetical protein
MRYRMRMLFIVCGCNHIYIDNEILFAVCYAQNVAILDIYRRVDDSLGNRRIVRIIQTEGETACHALYGACNSDAAAAVASAYDPSRWRSWRRWAARRTKPVAACPICRANQHVGA